MHFVGGAHLVWGPQRKSMQISGTAFLQIVLHHSLSRETVHSGSLRPRPPEQNKGLVHFGGGGGAKFRDFQGPVTVIPYTMVGGIWGHEKKSRISQKKLPPKMTRYRYQAPN